MLKKESTYQYLQLTAAVILPWGLFFSEAIASIAVILFALPLCIYGYRVLQDDTVSACWPFWLIYGIILVSGFWSSDSTRWLEMLRVNLPFLFLPPAFYLWPEFHLKHRRLLAGSFILAGVALSLYIVLYFIVQPEVVLEGIRSGGSIHLPVHHVRSALFLAIAGILMWDTIIWYRSRSWQFWFSMVALGFLVAGIVLSAVRTGLILFCLGTVVTFITNRGYHNRRGLVWISLFSLLTIAAFFLIPTIREKWWYFLEDLRNYNSHSWWFYSDAVRWKSNVVGWTVFRDAPWWGVGLGDLLDEMHIRFYELENIRLLEYPHNLWITFLAGTGLPGFLLLNIAWVGVFTGLRGRPLVYRIIFLIFLVSCLVENTLLTSLGSISFVMLMLPGMVNCEKQSPG